jgi:fucose permease
MVIARVRVVTRSRIALLIALGIDNFGSGLFLPLALIYVTRVVGLSLATAGTTVVLGTIAGLLVPPIAGRLVDRVGPRPVVISSQPESDSTSRQAPAKVVSFVMKTASINGRQRVLTCEFA